MAYPKLFQKKIFLLLSITLNTIFHLHLIISKKKYQDCAQHNAVVICLVTDDINVLVFSVTILFNNQ